LDPPTKARGLGRIPQQKLSAFSKALGVTDRPMLLFVSRFVDVALVALILSAFT